MSNSPRQYVGDHLVVGSIDYPLADTIRLFPGSATINGPLISGANRDGPPLANASFGPGFTGLPSLESIGVTNIFGSFNVFALSKFVGITNKFGATFKYALSYKAGADIKNAINLGNGPTIFNGPLTANNIEAKFIHTVGLHCDTPISAPAKHFNIPHPSKPGYRLVHSCLEGPEAGVYYRGRLEGTNTITLPDYWDKLIDPNTITVHFTPRRYYQELYVKSIEWGKFINVINNSGGSIDCDFIVYAQRVDVERLQIEVKE